MQHRGRTCRRELRKRHERTQSAERNQQSERPAGETGARPAPPPARSQTDRRRRQQRDEDGGSEQLPAPGQAECGKRRVHAVRQHAGRDRHARSCHAGDAVSRGAHGRERPRKRVGNATRQAARHAGDERLAGKRARDVVGIVQRKRRQRVAHGRRIGAVALLARQAVEYHLGKQAVNLHKRAAKVGRRAGVGQLVLRMPDRDGHLGLAHQQRGDVVAPRMRHHRRGGRGRHLHAIRGGHLAVGKHDPLQLVGGSARSQPIGDARGRIHVDARRLPQPIEFGKVVGEHLGRREIGRGAAHHGVRRRERRRTATDLGRRPEVDEVQVERALVNLVGERKARGSHHHVARADVAMRKPAVNHVHARDEVEHVARDARRRQGRQAPGVVDGQRPGRARKRDAFDPFHDYRGGSLDAAATIQAREPLQPGKAAVALVFMLESGAKPGDAAIVGVGRLVILALGKRQQLDGQALGLRIARAGDAGHAAALLARVGHEQGDETAHIGRALIGRNARRGLEIVDAHDAHAFGGRG